MQKWEYLRLYAIYMTDHSGRVRMLTANGSNVIEGKKTVELHKYLADLGKDGWELVNVSNPYGDHWVEVLYLKRQLEQ